MGKQGDPRSTRQWRNLKQQVLAGSERCWLCGQIRCERGCCSRANTGDHVLPVTTHPELALEPSNVKPAHKCCNSMRGDAPPSKRWNPTTREW